MPAILSRGSGMCCRARKTVHGRSGSCVYTCELGWFFFRELICCDRGWAGWLVGWLGGWLVGWLGLVVTASQSQPNSQTAKQPNSPTTQQPNNPVAQQAKNNPTQQPSNPTAHTKLGQVRLVLGMLPALCKQALGKTSPRKENHC